MNRLRASSMALPLCFGLLVAASSGALAQQAPVTVEERAQPDATWANEARNLTHVISYQEGLTFVSTRASPIADDRIVGAWTLDTGRFDLLYDDLSEPGSGPGVSLFLLALVEFRDLNGDGAFGLFDEVVQRVSLTGTHQARIQPQQFLLGEPIHPVANVPVPPAGHVRMELQINNEAIEAEGMDPLPPTHFPFELTIQDFIFHAPDSLLALETRARMNETVASTRIVDDVLVLRQGSHVLDYGWSPEAIVDGETVDVALTVLEAPIQIAGSPFSREAIVVFTYPQGRTIEHGGALELALRPPIPLATLEELKGDWRVYVLGLGVAAAVVATVTWRRLHRPSRDPTASSSP